MITVYERIYGFYNGISIEIKDSGDNRIFTVFQIGIDIDQPYKHELNSPSLYRLPLIAFKKISENLES